MKEFSSMDIHADVVASEVSMKFWPDYNIDFSALRAIEILGVPTFAPNEKDTFKVLSKQYGVYYLIPDHEEIKL